MLMIQLTKQSSDPDVDPNDLTISVNPFQICMMAACPDGTKIWFNQWASVCVKERREEVDNLIHSAIHSVLYQLKQRA